MRTWHSSGPRNLKDAFNDIYSFYPAKTPPLHDIDVIEETHTIELDASIGTTGVDRCSRGVGALHYQQIMQ